MFRKRYVIDFIRELVVEEERFELSPHPFVALHGTPWHSLALL